MTIRRTFAGLVALAAIASVHLGTSAYPCHIHATASPQPRFHAINIFVDSGPLPLAAYQIEVIARFTGDGAATLVGVEGGEHPQFTKPPYYDPAALQVDQARERIIIAALSTAGVPDLPKGRTRVARLHMRVEGEPRYVTNLMVAGGPSAEKITALAQAVVVTTDEP